MDDAAVQPDIRERAAEVAAAPDVPRARAASGAGAGRADRRLVDDGALYSGGRLWISWSVMRERRELACSELGATAADVRVVDQSGHRVWEAWQIPCEDGAVVSDVLPLGEYRVVVQVWPWLAGFLESVTLTQDGRTVPTPVVIELFDEPEGQMMHLFAAARDYYLADTPPRQFPPSVAPAPVVGMCCAAEPYYCLPNPDWWTTPGWTTLGFAVTERHRASYSFVSSGSGASATFTIRALVDHDCDALYREYTLQGWVDENGNVVGGPITSSGPD